MSRKPLIRSPLHFYHLTSRSHDRDCFYLPPIQIWEIFLNRLRALQLEHGVEIASFVVLNQRFHLVLRSPTKDIDRVMFHLMMDTTRIIQKRCGRINRIFGGRYHGSLIQNEMDLNNINKFLAWLPVSEGLAENAEEYPLSSYYKNVTSRTLPIVLFNNENERGRLNKPFSPDEFKSIEVGLKKTVFNYQRNKSNRPIIPK